MYNFLLDFIRLQMLHDIAFCLMKLNALFCQSRWDSNRKLFSVLFCSDEKNAVLLSINCLWVAYTLAASLDQKLIEYQLGLNESTDN